MVSMGVFRYSNYTVFCISIIPPINLNYTHTQKQLKKCIPLASLNLVEVMSFEEDSPKFKFIYFTYSTNTVLTHFLKF